MSHKIRKFETNANERGDVYGFHCPGCGYGHAYEVPRWSWNGSTESPTFTPSLMVNRGMPNQCHLNVTDGKIIFHSDSHHSLAGKTVEMENEEL